MRPLINILTRTSGRPLYFNVCKNSILKQTYKNINHIISIDDDSSHNYIGDSNFIKVNKYVGKINKKKGRRASAHNLYFNEMHNEVKEGWIMYLDDDDMFSSDDALQTIVDNISGDNDLILWRVNFKIKIVPEDNFFGKKPVLNHFASNSFLYNKKFINKWGYYSGGDYDYIMELWDRIENKKFINKTLTSIQRSKSDIKGWGRRDDIGTVKK